LDAAWDAVEKIGGVFYFSFKEGIGTEYDKAEKFDVKVISEDEFFEMIKE